MRFLFVAAAALAALCQLTPALAWGGMTDYATRAQMAMNSQAANIYSAVNGYSSTFQATTQNQAIASAVPFNTIPSLYLTTSYQDDGPAGYYWGG